MIAWHCKNVPTYKEKRMDGRKAKCFRREKEYHFGIHFEVLPRTRVQYDI